MSTVWTAMKKSLNCKSNSTEVYDPKLKTNIKNSCCNLKSRKFTSSSSSSTRRRLSCKSTIKDVINNGSKRFKETSANRSPLSIRSSDLINPVTHHVRFTKSELKITKNHHQHQHQHKHHLHHQHHHHHRGSSSASTHSYIGCSSPAEKQKQRKVDSNDEQGRRLLMEEGDKDGEFRQACHKCGEPLARLDAEEHHLSKHAVTEIPEGDSSRKVIEILFKAGWTNAANRAHVERILKVHNPQTKLAQFEEYREMVKIRANKLQNSKKHPRLLADGNELLRFYGTTIACSLGKKGSSNLCTLQKCNVCCILRHGFLTQDETKTNVFGIFTSSTSEGAYRSIELGVETSRKALIVCRVIAGRVHRPMVDSVHEFVGGKRSGFDSLAGKLGLDNSHVEELFLLKSLALLPCFVIICKQ